MTRRFILVLSATVLVCRPALAEENAALWPSTLAGEIAADREIGEQLGEPTRMDFEETPLGEVCDYLSDMYSIPIQLDEKALDEIGVGGSHTPVTIRVRDITLRSALRIMLKSVDPTLTYTIQNEVLLLTTREEESPRWRIYNVSKLVDGGGSAEQLLEALMSVVDTDQVFDPKNPSRYAMRLSAYRDIILVRGRAEQHQMFASLLAAMHRGLTNPEPPAASGPKQRSPRAGFGSQRPPMREERNDEERVKSRERKPAPVPKDDPFGGGGQSPFRN